MTDTAILEVLKLDLQIAAAKTPIDNYLNNLVELSKAAISKEGIVLTESVEDGMLVEMYAAFLYRKRKESEAAMPRTLRWQLNNRLLSQKAKEE